MDINRADLQLIKRIPGVGVQSALRIVSARKFSKLTMEHLQKMGVALNRAKYFIAGNSFQSQHKDYLPTQIKQFILSKAHSKYFNNFSQQMSLF